jgi:hypothetical protein
MQMRAEVKLRIEAELEVQLDPAPGGRAPGDYTTTTED